MDLAGVTSLLGAAKGLSGGGSTKISQTSNNTSNAVLSFNNVSNIGGGVNSNPNNPVSTPQSTNANAGGSDSYPADLPAYSIGGSTEVAASAGSDATAMDTNTMALVAAAGIALVFWMLSGK